MIFDTDPPTTTSPETGAARGIRVGHRLDGVGSDIEVLHKRRIPDSRADIDHLVVGASGVFVIDTKRYHGRIELRSSGTWLRPGPCRLMVGDRDRTKLVDDMSPQVGIVTSILHASVPITPVLCFVDAEWGPFAEPFMVGGVHLMWPEALVALVTQPGPLLHGERQLVAGRLAAALPAA